MWAIIDVECYCVVPFVGDGAANVARAWGDNAVLTSSSAHRKRKSK